MRVSLLSSLVHSAAQVLLGLLIAAPAHAVPTIVVGPGTSPGGDYLALSAFGVTPIAGVGDETISNFNVPSFAYAGQIWTRLGAVSDGYVLVGGGTGADVLATLTDGADTWIVVDWEAVRNSGNTVANSFQVWIGVTGDVHPGEDISFAYGAVGSGNGGLLTVGAQDISRTVGDSYYFNGTGALPVAGTQLRVTTRDLPVSVPESGALMLLGVGLAALTTARRHRRH